MQEETVIQHNDLARTLFKTQPKPECSIDVSLYEHDTVYVFQFLLNLLFEGLNMFHDLSTIDLKRITADNITALNPWFKSIKFKIIVDTYTKEESDMYNDYYCRIMLKRNDAMFFKIKHIPENFHFIINGTNVNSFANLSDISQLNKLKAICNINDVIFVISFKYHVAVDVMENKTNMHHTEIV